MAQRPDSDDDDFDNIYKEYTGPPVLTVAGAPDKAKPNKRSHVGSDEEEEPYDPNAVPTDFTSREAKVWEAKSKATERNWKKRKEEEMICKLCGESGHFTQGCPSTLGANRKSQDFIERVVARDKHVKALFTEKVIRKIEEENGCKLKMEEKFLIVSGKDKLVLAKGVDAVHKVIKEEGGRKDSSSSHMIRSRSPERSPVTSRFSRSESLRSVPNPPEQRYGKHEKPVEDRMPIPSPPRYQSQQRYRKQEKLVEYRMSIPSPQRSLPQQRYGKQEKLVEDRVREDLQKFSRSSSQGRDSIGYIYGIHIKLQAYVNDGARGRSSRSKFPAPNPYMGNSYNSYDDSRSQSMGVYRTADRDSERGGSDIHSKLDYPALPKLLEELELEYKKESMDLSRNRDKEEDEENYKHREAIREIRENYVKKLSILRGMHAKQWEEFLELDIRRGQKRAKQQISNQGFSGYTQPIYSDYGSSSGDLNYTGGKIPMDSRGRYPPLMEIYPPSSSRPHDTYVDFQRQRRDDYGNTHNRY